MKSSKVIILLSIILVFSLSANILSYFKPDFIKEITRKIIKEDPIFEISNVKLNLLYAYDENGIKDGGIIRIDCEVLNISNTNQMLHPDNFALFDFEKRSYKSSFKYQLKGDGETFTQLAAPIFINPQTRVKVSVVFEVPRGEFYCLGCSDNINLIGEQLFVDENRHIQSSFDGFSGMLDARNKYGQTPIRGALPQY